jgi:hypothetical protein
MGHNCRITVLGFGAFTFRSQGYVALLRSCFSGLESIGQNRNKTLLGFQGSSWSSEGEGPTFEISLSRS